MRLRSVVALAVVVVGSSSGARADDQAAAETAYERAKALANSGDFAHACPLFETSFKIDAALGTLLNLADCNERLGKTATAWAEFTDLLQRAQVRAGVATEPGALAKNNERIDYAKAHIAGLEPRLMRLQIAPPNKPVDGLAVRRDGNDVTTILGVDVPVDPGSHAIEARAPGRAAWKTEVTLVDEGKTVTVTLPDLAEAGAAAPVSVAVAPTPTVVVAPRRSLVLPIAVAGGALALGVTGLVVELSAESTYNQAKAETTSQSRRNSLYDSANDTRHLAQGIAIGGAVAAGAAVWLFLRDRGAEPAAPAHARRFEVVPTGAGAALVGSY